MTRAASRIAEHLSRPTGPWTSARKLVWFVAFAAVCYWSWFLIDPHL